MRRTSWTLAASAAAIMFSLPAFAQTQGAGFPIGEKSRIHTNIDLGVGYDSNPDRGSGEAMGTPVKSDWKGLIRPAIEVDVPGSSFSMGLKTQLTINQYFGTSSASPTTTVGAFIGGKAQAGTRSSPVGFKLEDQLIRTPAYIDDPGALGSEERRFKAWANRGQATLGLRPGGGALEFDFGYINTITAFDDSVLPFSQRHGALFEAKLRFLPKTAAVFHSDFSFFSADSTGITNAAMMADMFHQSTESTPYNVTIGLIGQITPKISTNLAVGIGDTLTWDNGFFSAVDSNNARTVIGTAEVSYDINEASRIDLGYKRQVEPIIVLNNYRRDAVFLRALLAAGARLTFSAFGQYEFRGYLDGERKAQILTGDVRADYWFFEFLTAAINYRVLRQSADNPTGSQLLENYTRHELFVSLGLRY